MNLFFLFIKHTLLNMFRSNLKKTAKKKNTNNRPIEPAKNLEPGEQSVGRDNKTKWFVAVKSNGTHYWKKLGTKKTNKKTTKKSTKKSTKKTNSSSERKRYLNSIRGTVSNYMKDHIIVLSGKMWDTRKNVEECLTEHGAVITSKITHNTSALIVGDHSSKSVTTKILQANEKDIDIISSDDLYNALYG